MVALGPDVSLVADFASKVALSLLASIDGSPMSNFISGALGGGLSYVILGLEPEFWIFPRLFASTPSQYAGQTLWIRPVGDPECPVCGDASQDDDASPLGSVPDAQALRRGDQ